MNSPKSPDSSERQPTKPRPTEAPLTESAPPKETDHQAKTPETSEKEGQEEFCRRMGLID